MNERDERYEIIHPRSFWIGTAAAGLILLVLADFERFHSEMPLEAAGLLLAAAIMILAESMVLYGEWLLIATHIRVLKHSGEYRSGSRAD